MARITAFFLDVGGVVLKNGWDRGSRRQLAEKFQLDGVESARRLGMHGIQFYDAGQLEKELRRLGVAL